jgi:hypothetical protein
MERLDNADARRERELRQRAAVLKQRPPNVRPPPVMFCKVDVNECDELAVEFRIPCRPCVVLIQNGIQVNLFVAGSPDKSMLADAVRFLRGC